MIEPSLAAGLLSGPPAEVNLVLSQVISDTGDDSAKHFLAEQPREFGSVAGEDLAKR